MSVTGPVVRAVSLALLLATGVAAQDDRWDRARRLYEDASRPVEALRDAVEADGQDPWARYFLARALADAKFGRAASEEYARAARLAPDEGFVVGDRAALLAGLGAEDEAIAGFREAARRARDEEQRRHFADRAAALEASVTATRSRTDRLRAGLAGALVLLVVAAASLHRLVMRRG
ncbi:MAG: hypothetical protein R3F20_04125 [Planctomycetota bacterium]